MINKKGQVLVLFIILLPLFLMVLAIVIDTSVMMSSKIKGEDLLESAIQNNYDINEYFKINDIELKNVEYYQKNNKNCVIINYDTSSIFGSIIGIKEYKIKIEKCGEKNDKY